MLPLLLAAALASDGAPLTGLALADFADHLPLCDATSTTDVRIDPVELAHCSAEWIRTGRRTDRVVLYFPGGGWALRSPRTHRRLAASVAKAANADVLLVFYRLAPEHPFPAALEDCVGSYEQLLDDPGLKFRSVS